MKDKTELFKLLRESCETPQESFAVEEMIRKVEGKMPPIEIVNDTQKKFAGLKFYKKRAPTTVAPSVYTVSFGFTLIAKFPTDTIFIIAISTTTITIFQISNSSRRKSTRTFILKEKLSADRLKKQNLSVLFVAQILSCLLNEMPCCFCT